MCDCKFENYNPERLIQENLKYLRRERAGKINGDEHVILENLFNYLNKKISENDSDYYMATLYEIGVDIYGKESPKVNYVGGDLRQLVFLGNISMEGEGKHVVRTFKILKPLEF